MATSRVDILLAARNNASGPIKQVQGDLAGLDKTAGALTGGLGSLAKIAGVAGLAALGTTAVDVVGNLIDAASDVEEQTAKFNTVFRQFGAETRRELAIFADAVNRNRFELEAWAATLQDTFVPLGFVRGQAADMSVEVVKLATDLASFNNLNTGDVIRDLQSALVGNHETMRKYGVVITETVLNLELLRTGIEGGIHAATEQEKAQARLGLILAGTTDAQGDAARTSTSYANEVRGLQAEISELAVSLGDELLPTITTITRAAREMISALNEAREQQGGEAENLFGGAAGKRTLVDFQNQLSELNTEFVRLQGVMSALQEKGSLPALKVASGQLLEVRDEMIRVGAQYNNLADIMSLPLLDIAQLQNGIVALVNTEIAIEDVGNAAVIVTGKVDDLMRALNNQAFAQSQRNWQQVTGAIDNAADAAGRLFAENLGSEAGLARQKALTAELTAQWGLYQAQGYETEQIANILMPAYIANIADADRALFKTTEQTKALSDATREAERAFDDLKSKVSSVLQGALEVGVGVNPADFLPREDAINENARRLADIVVNGFKDQDWLGSFQAAVPDLYKALAESGDPQTAAAQMLREFEAGLRPELIDKEAAKERVRQMLLGEQNLAELAQEIASELAAEMPNVGAGGIQSIVSQALGLRGADIEEGMAAGQQYAEGAKAAVAEQAPGTVMVATLTAQLKLESNLALLRGAGGDAGNVWGMGFLASVESGVPTALIELLVRLITPGVEAGQAIKTTLEGAAP